MKRFLFLLLFCSFSVWAKGSYLEVSGVTTKEVDKDSLAAKQKALSSSANKAFNRLLDSYFPEAVSLKNKILGSEIQNCVYDYSIDQEKFSGKTYIARFSFRFSKKAVKNILRNHNISSYEEKKSKTSTIALYTQDYLDNYAQLRGCKVILFSPRRIILEIPVNRLKSLASRNVAFKKVNAEIHP
ncbi:MAG: hypothetical protein K5780_03820 [Alphaproteobacteria bacterium]|nr:hypothetical protein [Alphaproteobacteria bacterium]